MNPNVYLVAVLVLLALVYLAAKVYQWLGEGCTCKTPGPFKRVDRVVLCRQCGKVMQS